MHHPIKRRYVHITLSIPGNCALGPLEENVATLGEATCAPTMVAAGDILATTLAKVTHEKRPEQERPSII